MSSAEERASSHLCAVASEAVRLVAGDLHAAFRSAIEVRFKRDDHDPVTEHDHRAEERIRAHLRRRVPGSTVVGEEDGTVGGGGGVCWYVDPIDGTANFAHGVAFFCTSVGAVADGRIVAGAILDPIAGHLFTATLDGAYLNGRPLRSAGADEEGRALLISSYPSPHDLRRDGEAALVRLGALISGYGTVRRPGSAALSLAHVAAGWADAAFGTSVSPWDICAAQLLVTEAGGTYRPLSLDGGGPRWDARGYLAHTGSLTPRTLTRVADSVRQDTRAPR